jgi:hypothetical protein
MAVSPQTLRKSTDWVLTGDDEHGIFEARCATCKESSAQGVDDVRPVQTWALHHTSTHPEHRHYTVHATHQLWHVEPRTNPPATEPTAPTTPTVPSGQPAHRARPARSPRHFPGALSLRHTRNRMTRYAGPLFIATVSGALAFALHTALMLGVTRHG